MTQSSSTRLLHVAVPGCNRDGLVKLKIPFLAHALHASHRILRLMLTPRGCLILPMCYLRSKSIKYSQIYHTHTVQMLRCLCGRETIRQARADLAQLEKRAAEARKTLEQKEKRLADIAASVEGLRARIAALKAELGTEMLAQLSAAERQELATLAPQLTQLQVPGFPTDSHTFVCTSNFGTQASLKQVFLVTKWAADTNTGSR